MTSVPDPFLLRPATPDDAAACARVHHASWVETFAHLLPQEHWESDTLERRTANWERWLAGDGIVTVAEIDREVVGLGFAGAGTERGGHAPVRDGELLLLYVLAAHHGTGLGRALLEAVVAPGAPAQVWLAEENPRARRFYERHGFVHDGARFVDTALDLALVRHVR
jgi:GNAT superfamily N-acetyltransferase